MCWSVDRQLIDTHEVLIFVARRSWVYLNLDNDDVVIYVYHATPVPSSALSQDWGLWKCGSHSRVVRAIQPLEYLLCDAMHNAAYAMALVCPSVCMSVYCIETTKHTLKLFYQVAHHSVWTLRRNSDGISLNGDVEYRFGMKKSRFSTSISLCLGTGPRQDHGYCRTPICDLSNGSIHCQWSWIHAIIRR